MHHVHDDDVVLAAVLGRERQELPVGGEARRGGDEAERFVVAAERRLEQPALGLAGVGVREPEVQEVEVLLAEIRDLVAVGRERGRQVPAAARLLLGEQGSRHRPPLRPVADLGEVLLLHRVVPLRHQLLEGDPQHPLQRHLHPAARAELGDLADRLVAPALPDVGHQGLAETIGEDPVEVLRRRELAFERGIAQPHGGVGVHRAEREVLGHPLGEPQRRVRADDALHAAHPAPRPDVELELVGHLVLEDVLVFLVGAGQGEDVPVPEEVGEPAGALVDFLAGGVGLLEIGVRGVGNDRLALVELVIERPRQLGVGHLRHPRDVQRRLALRGIVVHVEVLGLDDLEVEPAVLDLVAAEILRRQGGRKHGQQARGHAEATDHGNFLSAAVASRGASCQRRSS